MMAYDASASRKLNKNQPMRQRSGLIEQVTRSRFMGWQRRQQTGIDRLW